MMAAPRTTADLPAVDRGVEQPADGSGKRRGKGAPAASFYKRAKGSQLTTMDRRM